jgi:AraC-like DNA-binding protein
MLHRLQPSYPDWRPEGNPSARPQLTVVRHQPGTEPILDASACSGAELKARIDDFLVQEKPYLRPGFTLTDMSGLTGLPRHVLSNFINKAYGMNFNSLINSHRVDYLKEIPEQDPEWRRLTLEALGRKAGFNSRNTLIKAFKKCTGECPSTFFSRANQASAEPAFSFAESLMRENMTN